MSGEARRLLDLHEFACGVGENINLFGVAVKGNGHGGDLGPWPIAGCDTQERSLAGDGDQPDAGVWSLLRGSGQAVVGQGAGRGLREIKLQLLVALGGGECGIVDAVVDVGAFGIVACARGGDQVGIAEP